MDLNTKKPNTEAEALQDIVAWSLERPLWQRDALRRLCSKATLSENDFDELISIAKGKEVGVQPLDDEDFPSSQAAYQTVNLKCIENIEHVNALAQGQRLSFNKGNGITVVYGDNGSGKSGYARILKNACRARMKDKQVIHPNIYSNNPGVPKATLSFTVDNQTQSEDWEQGKETDPRLSSVSVFDSSTANIHVDEENDVAYTPFPLELLRRLSVACNEIQRRLRQEVLALEKQTPDSIKNPKCKENTEVGKIVNTLNATSNKDQIESLATLRNGEKIKHEKLKADLAADPERETLKLASTKSQFESYYTTLQCLVNAAAPDKLYNIQIKLNEYNTKKKAANVAAESLFKDQPLPGVGAEVWRSLWEAARHYSDNDAYPNKLFPNTESDAKCVLCQQQLSPETTVRLSEFENFVKGESNKQLESARKEYRAVVCELENANISHEKRIEIIN